MDQDALRPANAQRRCLVPVPNGPGNQLPERLEHVVHALLAVVDALFVLHQGKKLAEGDPKTVMDSPEVHEIYLGVEADA